MHLPFDGDARRFDEAPRRVRDLRSDAVSGDERDGVRHGLRRAYQESRVLQPTVRRCYSSGTMSAALPAPRVRTQRANGLDHRLLEWSPREGHGATALLLHGYMDAAATWEPVAQRLREAGLTVLAPDLRGFGEAPRAPVGSYYHFADYVADVAALVVALGQPSPLFLVGHSMGGTIATLYAGSFPERVTKVALLEGLGPPQPDLASMPDRLRRWIDTAVLTPPREGRAVGTSDDALARLSANHPKVPPEVLASKVGPLTRDVGEGKVGLAGRPAAPHAVAGAVLGRRVRGVRAPHHRARLARERGARRLARGGRRGAPVGVPVVVARHHRGGGHMMHWTQPAALSDALVAFWRARSSGARRATGRPASP